MNYAEVPTFAAQLADPSQVIGETAGQFFQYRSIAPKRTYRRYWGASSDCRQHPLYNGQGTMNGWCTALVKPIGRDHRPRDRRAVGLLWQAWGLGLGVCYQAFALVLAVSAGARALAQDAPTIPPHNSRPLVVDVASDPILQLSRARASFDEFRDLVAAAVRRHPGTQESLALSEEAGAFLSEARARRLPSVDVNLSSYRVLSRAFSNDPQNIIERSRAEQRTDALLTVQQTVFDFGAGRLRVESAGARLRSAAAEVETAADQIALGAVAAWYDVFGYRALVTLTETFVANQRELKAAVQERVRQGVSAEGDVARVESYIASAETRQARFRRSLANAEARLAELTGTLPPPRLERAAPPDLPSLSKEAASFAAAQGPAVRAAEAAAEAARKEAKATKRDEFGSLNAGVDAGRYGVIENDRDYDIRARVSYRQRLFGGVDARTSQSRARASAAEARANRVREEAARDAAIAWSDVAALEDQLAAVEASYLAARRSRDVIAERFRVARGSLFDVVAAEDSYFEAATSYVQTLTELDAARYVLLSRTGRLLGVLAIEPASLATAK